MPIGFDWGSIGLGWGAVSWRFFGLVCVKDNWFRWVGLVLSVTLVHARRVWMLDGAWLTFGSFIEAV